MLAGEQHHFENVVEIVQPLLVLQILAVGGGRTKEVRRWDAEIKSGAFERERRPHNRFACQYRRLLSFFPPSSHHCVKSSAKRGT